MKLKILILIACAAIITLSFSFATSNPPKKANVKTTAVNLNADEPVGGFISEDKF